LRTRISRGSTSDPSRWSGCTGYYRSPSGRVVTQWPFSMSEFRERTQKPDDGAYEVAPRR
jgi:hypothetical protein